MKIGLVLAGGGARGAYQIGVWKALIELGIDKHIKVVSGTSIGALNAMLFQQGNYELAEEFWLKVKKEQILPIEEKELGLKGLLFALGAKNMNFIKKYIPGAVKAGTLTREGLNVFLEQIDFESIKNSNVKGYATCTRIPELKTEYFCINNYCEEDIRKILWATTAVPMVYDSQEINNISYLDGAMVDNVPVQPVYGESCDTIIVVHLSTEVKIDRALFPNTHIIEIVPEELDNHDLKQMLDFDINIIRKRMYSGYSDTIYKLKPIMEITRTIDKEKEILVERKYSFIEKFNSIFERKEK